MFCIEKLIVNVATLIRLILKFVWKVLVSLLFVTACTGSKSHADAYGNFEARDVVVSSESAGKLIQFSIEEGQVLAKDEMVGLIDTAILAVQKEQLVAQQNVVATKVNVIKSQKDVQLTQLKNMNSELSRFTKLFNDGAATSKQMDDMNGQVDLINKQLALLDVQLSAVYNEIKTVNKQIDLIDIRLNQCIISSPLQGTVLEKYCEQGELVIPGKSLFKIASLDHLILRAYVDESMLSTFSIGDSVKVSVDFGEKQLKTFHGNVIWVSANAEFTPKIVQTREERVNLVYAIKINVKNDGSLKIGMPGEVKF